MIERLTFPLAWENAGITDFDAWKRVAREKLFECMSALPPQAPFDLQIVDSEQREGYTVHKIEFNVSAYSRVPAYLAVPQGQGPFPAIVLLHDHGAEFFIGKEKMIRPFNVEESVAERAQEWAAACYGGQFTGDWLAGQGYVVLAVDALFWADRGRQEGVNFYDGQQALAANLFQLGMTWTGIITADDMRSVDLLESLPFVDGQSIGAAGFSMGAHRAWMLAAASDKVAVTAAICWMNTTRGLMTPQNNQLKGGSSFSMLLPGIRNWLDYPHVASIACSRPMLFFNGTQDKLFPVEGVKEAYAVLRRTWQDQQAEEHLVTRLWDLPHTFNVAMQQEVGLFFDRYLKNR
ncbi:MAG: dienelactone hydrolase family protein [Rikenellaceae bacterium]|nr:dienelactone hydrolase family protein [Rikenellaceae bacterium]